MILTHIQALVYTERKRDGIHTINKTTSHSMPEWYTISLTMFCVFSSFLLSFLLFAAFLLVFFYLECCVSFFFRWLFCVSLHKRALNGIWVFNTIMTLTQTHNCHSQLLRNWNESRMIHIEAAFKWKDTFNIHNIPWCTSMLK